MYFLSQVKQNRSRRQWPSACCAGRNITSSPVTLCQIKGIGRYKPNLHPGTTTTQSFISTLSQTQDWRDLGKLTTTTTIINATKKALNYSEYKVSKGHYPPSDTRRSLWVLHLPQSCLFIDGHFLFLLNITKLSIFLQALTSEFYSISTMWQDIIGFT